MTISNDTPLEISYTYQFEDCKQTNSLAANKKTVVWLCLFFFAILVTCELLLLGVALQYEFSLYLKIAMGIIPAVFLTIPIIFIPAFTFSIKKLWKEEQLLPLERRWEFNQEGIIIDKGYVKTFIPWTEIKLVREYNKSFFFAIVKNPFFNLYLESLPKRALTEEQEKAFYNLLLMKLKDKQLIKIKNIAMDSQLQ